MFFHKLVIMQEKLEVQLYHWCKFNNLTPHAKWLMVALNSLAVLFIYIAVNSYNLVMSFQIINLLIGSYVNGVINYYLSVFKIILLVFPSTISFLV